MSSPAFSSLRDTIGGRRYRDSARPTLDRLRAELIAERTESGHWEGGLSSSALATATAVSAISAVVLDTSGSGSAVTGELRDLIRRGIDSLSASQNEDGGFGDTDRSHSNIATSYLVQAASALAASSTGRGLPESQTARLAAAIESMGGMAGLRSRYGRDKTFVVPILCNLAIAGLISWDEVARLPFEAAVFPQSMYRFLQMPVVSYAIPALVAIGQTRHFRGRRAWLPVRWIRAAAVSPTLGVLRRMQPESGGYLEATPLTAFVVMNLAATGRSDSTVVREGLRFLGDSISSDGSWPIDTNLATWVTSLSISALAADPEDDGSWVSDELVRWHLACQHDRRHPFTGAEPGGWGWTDLSGAVPDSDDTPAAVIALGHLVRRAAAQDRSRIEAARVQGLEWLRRLQNRNGGWPTFCRGWGKLPFDRSSTDLTAHALRAFASVTDHRIGERCRVRAERFLAKQQRADGSWLPLWFGNQDEPGDENPVYGTSRVLMVRPNRQTWPRHLRGIEFLVAAQNSDGGWGGGPSMAAWVDASTPSRQAAVATDGNRAKQERKRHSGGGAMVISSIEETAQAVEALAQTLIYAIDDAEKGSRCESVSGENNPCNPVEMLWGGGNPGVAAAILGGVDFLSTAVEASRHRIMWPIGFYFAKLWYHERLYPLIFSVAALGRVIRLDHKIDGFYREVGRLPL